MIFIGGKTYELVHEHKNAWNADAFKERYSEVLDRYDYIVGDWGYNQLRLKGFFREGSPRATKESTIAGLQDYLQEYCNFGCSYFVLERAAVKSGAGAGGEIAPEEGNAPVIPAAGNNAPTLAGGHAFSDRKPYSWREHQSPVRSNRSGGDRKDASSDAAGSDASAERGNFSRGSAQDGPRLHGGGLNDGAGKSRRSQDGAQERGGRVGDRMSGHAQGQEDAADRFDKNDRSEKGHRGGGRKFHPKGPRHEKANRPRGEGGAGNGHRPEPGPRPEGGGRHEGRSRPEFEGGKRANRTDRGGQQGASQHRMTAASQQQRSHQEH